MIPLRLWPAVGCGALSGLLYWAAFPGVDVWPLTFVTFVPLYLATIGQTPKRAFAAGMAVGLTNNLLGFFWLLDMLKVFSGFPTPLCALFLVIICAAQGARFGVMGWLFARGQARGWPRIPTFLLAFAASELFPTLFDFYYGATVTKAPLLMQTAELGGPNLVGVLLLVVNVAIAEPLVAWVEKRKVDRRPLLAGAAVAVFAVGFGALRIHQVDALAAASEQVVVGIVQANMGLKQKRVDPEEGLHRHLALTAEVKKAGADLVVWSETSAMHAVRVDHYKEDIANGIGRRLGLPAIFGAVLVDKVADERRFVLYNTALSTDASGEVTGRYDKTYLLKFGEYLPLGNMFPILYKWSPNSGHFSPGESLDPVTVTVNGQPRKISVLICYEDILPGFTDKEVNVADPDLLVNMTNDAWFGDTSEPWEHLALATFRAVEHRRYLVRSTNSGVSAFVDPVGRVMDHTGTFTQEAKVASVRWMHAHTVFEAVGEVPAYLAGLTAVVFAFWRRPKRREASAA
jgi:apolipoprotein N-acyltransferase